MPRQIDAETGATSLRLPPPFTPASPVSPVSSASLSFFVPPEAFVHYANPRELKSSSSNQEHVIFSFAATPLFHTISHYFTLLRNLNNFILFPYNCNNNISTSFFHTISATFSHAISTQHCAQSSAPGTRDVCPGLSYLFLFDVRHVLPTAPVPNAPERMGSQGTGR